MNNIRKIDIAIDIVIVILVTYYVADELTDGEFSRELGVRIVKLRDSIKRGIEQRRTINKDTGRVIWDAIETLENRDDNTETG